MSHKGCLSAAQGYEPIHLCIHVWHSSRGLSVWPGGAGHTVGARRASFHHNVECFCYSEDYPPVDVEQHTVTSESIGLPKQVGGVI
eukprot:1158039-Pelagomonas_calceolata.AAC.1